VAPFGSDALDNARRKPTAYPGVKMGNMPRKAPVGLAEGRKPEAAVWLGKPVAAPPKSAQESR
jgi:hypothetical protein